MTLGTMRTELLARGYDYLSSTRANYYINEAYHEICEDADWPFLRTTSTAETPPAGISDMRTVESVFDATADVSVKPIDFRTLREITTDLTTTGTPTWYYLTSQTVLTTYPVGGSLTVTYFKVPTDLSADGDTPVVPTRFHRLIVDGAVLRAMKDNSDWEGRAQLRPDYERELAAMRHSLLFQNHDMPDFIASTRGHEGW